MHIYDLSKRTKEKAVEELRNNDMDELGNPDEDLGLRDMNLPGPLGGRGARQGFWNKQVDAAALVGADSKIDGGGSAGVLRVTRNKMRRGENESTCRAYL